tara:strand:- start:176 stop:751 length:576 start_codon:yes stop_codon:yes gene_type:complete
MSFFLIQKFKFKISLKDKKLLFLIFVNLVPVGLMFLTSMLTGSKIRTMWMTPFYLFFGVLIVYVFQAQINLKKLNGFTSVFLILFILSPFAYAYISITQTDKRTDYPGKEIAKAVQEWHDNKEGKIIYGVAGDEWRAGNLSYHLKDRPEWQGPYQGKLVSTGEKIFEAEVVILSKTGILSNVVPSNLLNRR